jgi:hypothetical protein
MKPDIDETMRRTQSYWYEDGLADIAVGVIFLLIGALFTAEAILPPGWFPGGLSALGLPVVVIGGWLIASRLVRFAKERITYPRTGFVRYQRPPRRHRPLAGLVGGLIAALLALLLGTHPASIVWIPALQGLLIGAFILFIGYRVSVARYYFVAVASALAGLVGAFAGLGASAGSAIYFLGIGAAFVVSGVWALVTYLRGNPPPSEA